VYKVLFGYLDCVGDATDGTSSELRVTNNFVRSDCRWVMGREYGREEEKKRERKELEGYL
jgi:hypothetical protein